MTAYRAPLAQLRFALHEVFGVEAELASMPAFSGVDRALIDQIIDEAAVFSSEVLAPTRTAGDAGCTLRDGRVFLPPGFADVYRRFVDAGWPRSEEHTSELQSLMRISYAVFCLKK